MSLTNSWMCDMLFGKIRHYSILRPLKRHNGNYEGTGSHNAVVDLAHRERVLERKDSTWQLETQHQERPLYIPNRYCLISVALPAHYPAPCGLSVPFSGTGRFPTSKLVAASL